MSFLDKLERRLGFIAIPGLIRAVVTLNALVFVLVLLNKGFDSYLALDIARIRAGEVWRLVTYIFVPQTRPFSAWSPSRSGSFGSSATGSSGPGARSVSRFIFWSG